MSEDVGASMRRMEGAFRSIYREMFFIAYAISGNDRAAERILVSVMRSLPAESTRVYAVDAIRRAALDAPKEPIEEMNFNCLTGDSEGADAFLPWLFERSDEYRRTVILRYGCGLNAREIAKATGAPLSGVRRDFEDARKTAARYAMDAKKCDRRLRAACGAEMAGYAGAPDWNTLMRAVENRMSEREGQRANAAPVKRAFSWALAMFTLVVLGAMIWMSVVLLDYYRQTRQSAQSAVRVGTQIMAAEDENARA